MLISSDYNFLFIHIPKVAGSSIENSLRRSILSPWNKTNWQIDIALRKLNHRAKFYSGLNFNLNNPLYNDPWQTIYDELGVRHALAKRIRTVLGQERYEAFFKFAFVRNPWARLVSQYEYILQTNHHGKRNHVKKLGSFESFIEDQATQRNINQAKWLVDDKNNLIVDYVGKLESIEKDYDFICEKLGINIPVKLSHSNRSQKRKGNSYRNYYSEYTKNLVYKSTQQDIELFGYTF